MILACIFMFQLLWNVQAVVDVATQKNHDWINDLPKFLATGQPMKQNQDMNVNSILDRNQNDSYGLVHSTENQELQTQLERVITDSLFKVFSRAREDLGKFENRMWNVNTSFEIIKLLNKFLNMQEKIHDLCLRKEEYYSNRLVSPAMYSVILLLVACDIVHFFYFIRLKVKIDKVIVSKKSADLLPLKANP